MPSIPKGPSWFRWRRNKCRPMPSRVQAVQFCGPVMKPAVRALTVLYCREQVADAPKKIRVLSKVLFNLRIFVGLFDVNPAWGVLADSGYVVDIIGSGGALPPLPPAAKRLLSP